MPELRLTLLVVGLIFLIALTWWELRRPHQARGSELPRPAPVPVPEPEPAERVAERTGDWEFPALELPRMSARDPEAQLPVIEVEAEDFAELEAQAEAMPAPAAPPPVEAPDMDGMDGLLAELGRNQTPDPPISDITESFRAALSGEEPFAVESVTVRVIEAPRPVPAAAAAAAVETEVAEPAAVPLAPLNAAPAAGVVVDWPAPESSAVLAVRLVCGGEKFSGRAVRMALASEGFVLGKFSIFHKPAADGRALLSIASLNKPGTFERQSIDLQRYSGLNLFTVLPGPLPGPDAVDELLACAQVLSQRLRGSLQDEQGAPLTPSRTAVMRNAAAAAPT
jgi:cell division protein ZipA